MNIKQIYGLDEKSQKLQKKELSLLREVAIELANREDISTYLYHDRFLFEFDFTVDCPLQEKIEKNTDLYEFFYGKCGLLIWDMKIPALPRPSEYIVEPDDEGKMDLIKNGYDQIVGHACGENYIDALHSALKRIYFIEKHEKQNKKYKKYYKNGELDKELSGKIGQHVEDLKKVEPIYRDINILKKEIKKLR